MIFLQRTFTSLVHAHAGRTPELHRFRIFVTFLQRTAKNSAINTPLLSKAFCAIREDAMKESDWKIFKEIKDKAIAKFCTDALNEFREAMDNEKSHIHERYLLNYQLVKNRDKEMALLFDGHSRSKAWLQLLAIRGKGIADEVLLAKLSEEFREQTDPKRHNW
ncbi:MAG: hypothetical protein ACI9T9_002069 [Oleiphilaceae bacterium]